MLRKIFSAFTLAEVLITLGIIGIVAAMTIPVLLEKTQEKELKVAWKKKFSELSSVTQMVLLENGDSFKNVCPTFSNCMRDLYAPNLRAIKKCDIGTPSDQCWTGATKNKLGNIQWAASTIQNNTSRMILADGSYVFFNVYDSSCSNTTYSGTLPVCGWFTVDVNGGKNPNVIGRDIFLTWILATKIVPGGGVGDSPSSHDCANSGNGCSADYLQE